MAVRKLTPEEKARRATREAMRPEKPKPSPAQGVDTVRLNRDIDKDFAEVDENSTIYFDDRDGAAWSAPHNERGDRAQRRATARSDTLSRVERGEISAVSSAQERLNAAADRAKRAALRPVRLGADATKAKPQGRKRPGDGVDQVARLQERANAAADRAKRAALRPVRPKPAGEAGFQAWYAGWAKKAGLDPNPDHPLHKYDYRAAHRAGAEPKIDTSDGQYHWPSEFKAADHPNRFVGGVDTRKSGRAKP